MNTQIGWAGAVLALLLGLSPAAVGQTVNLKDVRKVYTQKPIFKLPVQIDDKDRAELSQLKLYVKTVPGEWECRETVPATQREFWFRAPQDGEYWFTFASVDKAGTANPPNPDQEPPGLIVVVDTHPPEITVRVLPADSGPGYLQCKLIDANPDYHSIKMEYEVPGNGGVAWRPLEPVADMPGVFQVPEKSVLGGRIRVEAVDRAGNFAKREIDLGTPRASSAIQSTASMVSMSSEAKTVVLPPAIPAVILPDRMQPPGVLPPELVSPQTTSIASAPMDAHAVKPSIPPPALIAPVSETAAINSLRCHLAISIEPHSDEKPNVEMWATSDSGRSWFLTGQSRDGRNVVQAEFPKEGSYGYTFVVKSPIERSLPPAAGETPDGWIEVDMTKPVAELLGVTLGKGNDAGNLLVTWVAQDRSFGSEPISLFYALQPAGPWQPIAAKIANSGAYRWRLPNELSGLVYVRLEAIDRAGNSTRCDYPTPILIEAGRPRVKVLSITPAGKE